MNDRNATTSTLERARKILADDTALIDPARLAHLDQVAAHCREEGWNASEALEDVLAAFADPGLNVEEQLLVADIAYVAALALVGAS